MSILDMIIKVMFAHHRSVEVERGDIIQSIGIRVQIQQSRGLIVLAQIGRSIEAYL